ncbi:MAG: cupredoxin domain-containing protein [Vulcanimicrobiaceae bacterium]
MAKGPLVLPAFLVLAVAAMAVLLLVALSTRLSPLPYSQVQPEGYKLRRWWFLILSVGLVAIFAVTLPWFPYPPLRAAVHATKNGTLYVKVTAQQYAFTMPSVLPLDRRIVFEVTSLDVNHGFGIYDPRGQIVAQVQAMPDYVNHLPVTFTRAGRYTVRCLEYCGIGHASMQGGFDVR